MRRGKERGPWVRPMTGMVVGPAGDQGAARVSKSCVDERRCGEG